MPGSTLTADPLQPSLTASYRTVPSSTLQGLKLESEFTQVYRTILYSVQSYISVLCHLQKRHNPCHVDHHPTGNTAYTQSHI